MSRTDLIPSEARHPPGPDRRLPGAAPRRRRRRFRRVGAVVLGAAVVLGGLSVLPALSLRGRFEEGRALLERGQASLLAGEAADARRDFAEADRVFTEARAGLGTRLLRLEGTVPLLGRTPGALVDLAEIGGRISSAGLRVSRGMEGLPGGLSSLGPSDGRIPIEELASLASAIRAARLSLEGANRLASNLPDAWVPGSVAEARDLVRAKLGRALPLARSADGMLEALPRFAGSDRPRRYFVAAENSAELRGTGGLIGNFAILTIDRGQISLGPFHDVQTLSNLPPSEVPAPSQEFRDLYDPFGGGGFWLNLNMTPDAPTAASLIERLYERVEGERLDGTIFFDLQGLADLLGSTGKVRVPELEADLTADNLVAFVATAQYLATDISNPFQEGPRLVAEAVWTRFLQGADPEASLEALVGAAARGHLKLHAADPQLQGAFRLAGVAGEFGAHDADFVGVVLSNAGANKVDYYLQQDVRYEVTLEPGGNARGITTVALENRAPVVSEPSYPLGPSMAAEEAGLHLKPGENRWWASVYCAAMCWLRDAELNERPVTLEAHREKGQAVFAGFVGARAGQTATMALPTARQGVWEGDGAAGSYRVRLQGQPLIHPATATVVIHAPPGTSIAWTSEPMEVAGRTAVWRGSLVSRRDLEVRFQRGFFGRVWTRVWRFLTKPAIRL